MKVPNSWYLSCVLNKSIRKCGRCDNGILCREHMSKAHEERHLMMLRKYGPCYQEV